MTPNLVCVTVLPYKKEGEPEVLVFRHEIDVHKSFFTTYSQIGKVDFHPFTGGADVFLTTTDGEHQKVGSYILTDSTAVYDRPTHF